MGFVDGDRVDWRRWWFPRDASPQSSNGLLFDSASEYFAHLNPTARTLSEIGETRCLVLLGEPGSGKSDELEREANRLRDQGVEVMSVDLGSLASWPEVESQVGADLRARLVNTFGQLAIVLDGFDEALFDVVNLADVLARELGPIDHDRVLIRISARPAAWSRMLEEKLGGWWADSFDVRTLGPLSATEVEQAAATDLSEPLSFVDSVRQLGLGPLAARPIGLKLLLAGLLHTGMVASSRVEAYSAGVLALASEQGRRRIERGRAGPEEARRVEAAEALAVFTLLCGRPRVVVRRAFAHGVDNALPLETIATAVDNTLIELEAVVDSGLFAPAELGVEWVHRSLAEYLAARRLAQLPMAAVRNLLTHPDHPEEIVPQLAEVASWVSSLSPTFFNWLAQRHPESLLNPDLPGRSEAQRRAVGAAVFGILQGNEPPTSHWSYIGLDYAGIDDDLRSLLGDASKPWWSRREAIMIVRDNGRRDFDHELVAMVEAAVSANGGAYGDAVSLARWALIALEGCADTSVLERLRVVFHSDVHRAVRGDLARLLGPARLPMSELLSAFGDVFDRSDSTSREIASLILERLEQQPNQLSGVFDWLASRPNGVRRNPTFIEFGAVALTVFLNSSVDDAALWRTVIHVTASQIQENHDVFGLTRGELGAAPAERRAVVALSLLTVIGPKLWAAMDLRTCGLIGFDDLSGWLDRHADALEAAAGSDLTGAVLWALARPTETEIAVARAAAKRRPVLTPIVDQYFGAAAVADFASSDGVQAEREARRIGEMQQELFSRTRLDDALVRRDWPAVASELRRDLSVDAGPKRAQDAPLMDCGAWQTLDEPTRSSAVSLAVVYLGTATPTYSGADAFCDAFLLVSLLASDAVTAVAPTTWLAWLPWLIELPGRHDTPARILRLAAEVDPAAVEQVVLDAIARDTGRDHLFALDRLGPYWTDGVGDALVGVVSDETTGAFATGQVLAVLLERSPGKVLAKVHSIVVGRGSKPLPSDGAPLDHERAEVRRWDRAVMAAVALCASPACDAGFDSFFAEAQQDVEFFKDVVRQGASSIMGGTFLRSLDSERLADLYMWARAVLPTRLAEPGVAISYDSVAEFSNDVFRMLTDRADRDSAVALDRTAATTHDDWHRAAARDAWRAVRARSWAPFEVRDLAEVLADPRRRVVRSEPELAALLLEGLRAVELDISGDTKVRRRYWYRQRVKNNWRGWVPRDEPELSDELALSLGAALRGRVVVGREVELQARLGHQPGEVSDILVSLPVPGSDPIHCVIEVKGNWHDEVITAIHTQLARRYLGGSISHTGIYIVGYFAGSAWDDETDGDRRRRARRRTVADLEGALAREADGIRSSGVAVHVFVMNLSLEVADLAGEAE